MRKLAALAVWLLASTALAQVPLVKGGGGGSLKSTDIDTSSELATILTDETGSGAACFATAPTFTTSITTPVIISGAADTADAGFLRMGNNEGFAWENSTPGTDITCKVDASNVFACSGAMSAGSTFTASTSVTTGGLTVGAVTITSADSTYTLPAAISVIFCNATGGTTTITTGSAASNFTGRIIQIKKTDSGSNSCTFDPNGSETVDGSATHTNTIQYQSFTYVSDGTNWFII